MFTSRERVSKTARMKMNTTTTTKNLRKYILYDHQQHKQNDGYAVAGSKFKWIFTNGLFTMCNKSVFLVVVFVFSLLICNRILLASHKTYFSHEYILMLLFLLSHWVFVLVSKCPYVLIIQRTNVDFSHFSFIFGWRCAFWIISILINIHLVDKWQMHDIFSNVNYNILIQKYRSVCDLLYNFAKRRKKTLVVLISAWLAMNQVIFKLV